MVNIVKMNLAGRIDKYVNRRRKSEGTFGEALSGKVAEAKPTSVTDVAQRTRSASARPHLYQRTAAAAVRAARKMPAQGYSQRLITNVQANRLAGYAHIIQEASGKYGVPVELICAVILQESGGKYNALSHCGARGLMQLMPATAKRLGVANSLDPYQNIMGGTKYLRMLLDRFGGNMALALAGYNAGEGNVEKYGRRIPPFRETRAYVPNVLKYADTLWNILKTPVKRVSVQPTIHHRTIYNVSRRA